MLIDNKYTFSMDCVVLMMENGYKILKKYGIPVTIYSPLCHLVEDIRPSETALVDSETASILKPSGPTLLNHLHSPKWHTWHFLELILFFYYFTSTVYLLSI